MRKVHTDQKRNFFFSSPVASSPRANPLFGHGGEGRTLIDRTRPTNNKTIDLGNLTRRLTILMGFPMETNLRELWSFSGENNENDFSMVMMIPPPPRNRKRRNPPRYIGKNGAIKTPPLTTHNKETRCDASISFGLFLNETTRFVIFITGLKLTPHFCGIFFLSLQDGLVG